MSALAILVCGGLVLAGLWTWLAGRRVPAPRARGSSWPVGARSAQEIVAGREALEAEDLAQLLAAHNARRRRRGEPERTLDDVELSVAADAHEARRGSERRRVADDLDELLAATNARRRARGLPERTREQAERELGGPAGARP